MNFLFLPPIYVEFVFYYRILINHELLLDDALFYSVLLCSIQFNSVLFCSIRLVFYLLHSYHTATCSIFKSISHHSIDSVSFFKQKLIFLKEEQNFPEISAHTAVGSSSYYRDDLCVFMNQTALLFVSYY